MTEGRAFNPHRLRGFYSKLPDVYALAVHLAQCYDCTHLIDLGCGQGQHLALIHPHLEIIGIDTSEAIRYCRSHHDFGTWLDADLDATHALPLDPQIVSHAVVVCNDRIGHPHNPDALFTHLHALLENAPVALITASSGDLADLKSRLEAHDLRVEFAGHAAAHPKRRHQTVNLAVLANHQRPPIEPAPDDFRVVALIAAYNEADIFLPSLQHLIAQGIEVYLIDNWSTDGMFEMAQSRLGKDLIGVERCPATQPDVHQYDWPLLLERKVQLALDIDADWFIHYDVDELRESPWPEISLRDAIYHVDQCGYNAIDFTVVEFHPIDDGYLSGTSIVDYFRYYTFPDYGGYLLQVKAWKRTSQPVTLAPGGHRVRFENQRIYPYNFLLKHYPLRSVAQSQTKILERQRSSREFRTRTLYPHRHYNNIRAQNERFFDELCRKTLAQSSVFDPETFYTDYLLKRITRVGFVRQRPPLIKRLRKTLSKGVSALRLKRIFP